MSIEMLLERIAVALEKIADKDRNVYSASVVSEVTEPEKAAERKSHKKKEPPKEEPKTETKVEDTPPPTVDEVRAALVKVSAAKGKDYAIDLLKTVGKAAKLTEVTPDRYAEIVKQCKLAEARNE